MVSGTNDSGKGYRGRLEIIRDILIVLRNKRSRKTHIMYGANLSYKLLIQYLEEMLKACLTECDGNFCYTITEKGNLFLKLYENYEKKRREIEKRVNFLNNGRETLEKMLMP